MEHRNLPLNEGRESLFDLELDALYLVEGSMSGEFTPPSNKEHVSRYAIEKVLIKEYRTDRDYKDIPVVAFAQHLNFIRKQENLQYINTKDGARNTFIGRLYEYETKGVKRRSFKMFRDSNLLKDIRLIEKRIRTLNSVLPSLPPEEVEVRCGVTRKMVGRLSDCLDNYIYVPWVSEEELLLRLKSAEGELSNIQTFSLIKNC